MKTLNIFRESSLYIREQFPPFQAAALFVAGMTVFLIFAAIADRGPRISAAIVCAITVALMFLQVRMLDDLDTYYIVGPEADIANATPRGLIWGEIVVGILSLVINRGSALAAASVVVGIMVAAELVMRRWRPGFIAIAFGRIPLFDIAPFAAFAYVYFQWRMSTHVALPVGQVAVVVTMYGLLWEIWKFSRNIAKHDFEGIYRPYRLEWPVIRTMLVGMTVLEAGLIVYLATVSRLSTVFVTLAVVFSAWYTFLARPTGKPEEVRPWWRGLFYPGVMAIGLFVQMLILT